MRRHLYALAVLFAVLSVTATYAVESRMMTAKEFVDEKFGSLPVHEKLITGIQFDSLMISLLGSNYSLLDKRVNPNGVNYLYRGNGAKYPAVSASVGVYENQNTANYWFSNEWARTSGKILPRPELGDRAFVNETRAIVLINNVLVDLSVREKDQKEMLDKLLESILNELKSGSTFVSRGKCVNMPVIQSVGLPDHIKLGQKAAGKIMLSNIDLSTALIANSAGPASIKFGKECDVEIGYSAPTQVTDIGTKTFTLCVATPENVIAIKDITVVVEK